MESEAILADNAAEAVNLMATLGKTAVSLLFVIGIIYALSLLVKKLNRTSVSGGNLLKHIASMSVGTRERVVVVEVNGTWLVLGVGNGQVTRLSEMSAPPVDPQTEQKPQAAPFSRHLDQLLHRKKQPGGPPTGTEVD